MQICPFFVANTFISNVTTTIAVAASSRRPFSSMAVACKLIAGVICTEI